ncbi:MAG: hotdog domain-containing protein, partial [Ruminococcus sp.]|nr:hotdog domain-containing protein [Ruminococcus sp.]
MTEKTVFQKIEQPQLASAMGSGSLDVLATPAVVALMEYAASSLADELLGNKELTTVGTRIAIDHTSPTPVGAEVTATARLIAQNGRTFEFEVSAADQKGEIARGTHTRVSVKAKSFQQKADTKFNRYTYVLFDLDGT